METTPVVEMYSNIEAGSSKYRSSKPDLSYAYAERASLRLTKLLAFVAFIGAFINLMRLIKLGRSARAKLENRMEVSSEELLVIQRNAGRTFVSRPKLSIATCLDGPISIPNGEIVVPAWFFKSLSDSQRRAVYAHELAHQYRYDPIWLIFLHLMNAVLWIQPLNKLVRRRLVHCAELQADAMAAQMVSDSRLLAESLLICAEKIVATPNLAFGSTFSSRSDTMKGGLMERIDSLLEGPTVVTSGRLTAARWATVSFMLIAALLMPGCNVDSEVAYRSGESISVTKQGDGKKGDVTIRRANLFVNLTHSGSLKLNADNNDVESLEKHGRFVLKESQGKTKRLYSITTDELGNLKRSYSLNGNETVIDQEVKDWFSSSLSKIVRETDF